MPEVSRVLYFWMGVLCLLICSIVKYCNGESEHMLRGWKKVSESNQYLADVFKAIYRKLWFQTLVGIVTLLIRNKTKHSLKGITLFLGLAISLFESQTIWLPNFASHFYTNHKDVMKALARYDWIAFSDLMEFCLKYVDKLQSELNETDFRSLKTCQSPAANTNNVLDC